MKKGTAEYEKTLAEATSWLFDEFLRWNEIQGELKVKGYENDHYGDGEVARERSVFKAIAERFVLEDIDFHDWEWLETPWVGTDGNTGNRAYVIDFVRKGVDEPEFGILGFYVTRNHRFWYALPLAEELEGNVSVYEVNSIGAALGILECLNPDERESTRAE